MIGLRFIDVVIYIKIVNEKGGEIKVGKGNWDERKEFY